MDNLKNIMFLFPVMGYYLIESAIIAIFTAFAWRFLLQSTFNFAIGYVQWVAIIWIIKIVFFDVFKLISGLSNVNNQIKEEES